MFYPADSLKRGGRFYLCWVADSWPLRFATITHRQLWSQDIRRICDDLLGIMTKESGRPTQRFSLRLSSQLLRGLVRLYQRKVNVFLGELCMIHANVIKNTNKKWNVQDGVKHDGAHGVRQVDVRPQLDIVEIIQEPQEPEQHLGEMIQASGNAVANIEDITLREAVLQVPDMLLKPNDGFGEENADQTLHHLQDRTMELMLLGHDISRAVSGGEPRDSTDMSRDKSHLHTHVAQVESISEQDITIFNKDIPDMSVILPPEISIPLPEKHLEVQEAPRLEESRFVPVEPPKVPEPEEIELEELLEEPLTKRRRLQKKMIIDKRIKISPQNFRERIENPLVELRCKDSYEDVICIRVPTELYFRRPCKGGNRIVTNVGFEINRLFVRNLGVVTTRPREEREMEEVLARSRREVTVLERIDEEVEPPVLSKPVQAPLELTTEMDVIGDLNITGVPPPRISVPEQMEVDTEALTQKVQTLSQATKRRMEPDYDDSLKRRRSVGARSFRSEIHKKTLSQESVDPEVDKENRNVNLPSLSTNIDDNVTVENAERIVSSLLQEAGLADIQSIPAPTVPEAEVKMTQRSVSRGRNARGDRSDGSETPLGSLDRTKVSLGDSDRTTDSIKFIRDQWGTEGTMLKILKLINGPHPVTVSLLIEKGPVVPGHKKIIAARCFTSILKLKQHGFINVCKDPDTLEVKNITLGTKLSNYY